MLTVTGPAKDRPKPNPTPTPMGKSPKRKKC